APAQILEKLPRPLPILGGAREEVEHRVTDRLAVAGEAEHAPFARDGRLRLVVDQADVVVMERAEIDVLPRVERLAGWNEAQVEGVGIGQLLLERALPPFERLPRDRP